MGVRKSIEDVSEAARAVAKTGIFNHARRCLPHAAPGRDLRFGHDLCRSQCAPGGRQRQGNAWIAVAPR
jgi:hypothetical protein